MNALPTLHFSSLYQKRYCSSSSIGNLKLESIAAPGCGAAEPRLDLASSSPVLFLRSRSWKEVAAQDPETTFSVRPGVEQRMVFHSRRRPEEEPGL